MLNGQLLIDFHVHLPQYAERTNSALEWFRSLCPCLLYTSDAADE